jgi:N6-adenosine-specific RNA methylase IME4
MERRRMFEELNPPYSTIVADPPWPDEHKLTGVTRVGRVKKERGIEPHYSTLSMEDIAALPVADIAAEDAHLYLWTTNLHLARTFAIMQAWGFGYRTMLTWCKTGHLGLGHYFRTNTEHVLFGVRGSLRTKDRRQGTHFTAAKQGHSVKPASFTDLVERCSPGPYVELFARQPRLGWDSWGYGYESRADTGGEAT